MKKTILYILLLIPVSWIHAQEGGTFAVVAKEGKDGIYLFVNDQVMVNGGKYREIRISRSAGKPGDLLQAGVLQPYASQAAFEQAGGGPILGQVMSLRKLPSQQEAWNWFAAHPDLKNYGLMALDVQFLVTAGAAWLDKSAAGIRQGTTVYYRVEYVTAEASGRTYTLEASVVKGTSPEIARPKVTKVITDDSTVTVTWSAPATASQEAVFGEVRRIDPGVQGSQKILNCFASLNAEGTFVTYYARDQVARGERFRYFVIPMTMTLLPGPGSDTATVMAVDFARLPQPSRLTAKDTLSGTWLSWTSPASTEFLSGIEVLRTEGVSENYRPIDTVPASAVSYLDQKVFPGLMYHYQVRSLTVRGNQLPAASTASVTRSGKNRVPEAPVNLRAMPQAGGIILNWSPSKWPETAGYFVYRSDNLNIAEIPVSNLMSDTVFSDTTARDGRRSYRYTVVTATDAGLESTRSNAVFATPEIRTIPATPTGFRGARDGVRVMLVWQDMKAADPLLEGYSVYRKQAVAGELPPAGITDATSLAQAGFLKITGSLLPVASFTDNTPGGGTMFYAVTATDLAGNESQAATFAADNSALSAPSPPTAVYLEKVSDGIRISWDRTLTGKVAGYVIYRRLPGSGQAEQLEVVNATKTAYTDTRVTKGGLYFYSVAAMGDDNSGKASLEKGIRY